MDTPVVDVFVVVGGEYSDFRIVKVFLDEEKANAFVEEHKGSIWDYRVQKWDTEREELFF